MMDPHVAPMSNFYANYPLRNIPHPHPHDVLCGRGGGTNAHIGNSHWRMLVTANKELYISLPKKQKMLLSKSIVNAVRSQHPPGRFLQKDSKTNLWYDVGDQRAQEKTSQALREGAPEIRTKIKGDGKKSGDSTDESGDDEEEEEDEKEKEIDSVPSAELATQTSRSQKQSQSPTPPAAAAPVVTSNLSNTGNSSAAPMMHPPPQYMVNQPVMHSHPYPSYSHPAPHHMHMQPSSMYPHHMYPQHGSPMHVHHSHMMVHGGHPHMPMHPMPVPSVPQMSMGPPGIPVVPIVIPAPVPPQGPVPERRNKKSQTTSSTVTQKDKNKSEPRNVSAQSELPVRSSDVAGGRDSTGHCQDQPTVPEPADLYDDPNQPLDLGYNIPPTALDDNGEFSFGSKFSYNSIDMTDFEHAKLINGSSFGSAMGHNRPVPEISIDPYRGDGRPPLGVSMNAPYRQNDRAGADRYFTGIPRSSLRSINSDMDSAPPVDGGLEPVGISFGSVGASVMSLGTDAKLEPGGLSFGSMMSYSVRDVPSAVDGGLEAIGTSFGSLSLATADRERLDRAVKAEIDEEAAAAAAAPTYLQNQKSKGNLLECSDSDSQDEDESRQSSARKSADWERLKATISTQSTVPMSASNPPSFNPRYGAPTANLTIPVTRFDRDFSQMSAISVGDDFESQVMPRAADYPDIAAALEMPPPPPMRKQPSDEWKQEEDLEYSFLARGNSLAGEYSGEHQYE